MVIQGYPRIVAITAGADPLPAGPTDAIYINVAGTIAVTMQGGNTATLTVIAGAVIPIRVTHVTALGGGATAHALYY